MKLRSIRKKLIELIGNDNFEKLMAFVRKVRVHLDDRTLLAIYITLLISGTLLFRDSTDHPLKYIWAAWLFSGKDSGNAVVNLGLMVPLICLLYKVYPSIYKKRPVLYGMLIGFCTSMMIETLQLVFHRGFFQFSDLFNNTISGALGGFVYLKLCQFCRWLIAEDRNTDSTEERGG